MSDAKVSTATMKKLGMRPKRVADLLDISESSVYDLIACKKLRAFKIKPGRGSVRVRPQDLEAFIEQRLVEVS